MNAPDALERLYDTHAGALFAFALNLTRSEPDARDLLQDLFHRLADRPMPTEVRDPRG
jgi:DNA-directed RNA polymerase specialized sigma24 family protein